VRDGSRRFLGPLKTISQTHWQTFRHFVLKGTVGKVFDLTSDVCVLKDREVLIFHTPGHMISPDKSVLRSGMNQWGVHEFIVSQLPTSEAAESINVRAWQYGDRYSGRDHQKGRLVSDLFTDAKLNLLEKHQWPMLTDDRDEILWIPGLVHPRTAIRMGCWEVAWRH
ncbi:tRNA lysidine(34) synthetase TilS, partial [Candidatus Neomarinimicrobiota bacterium]